MKTCAACGVEQPLSEFSLVKRYGGKRSPHGKCKPCEAAYQLKQSQRPERKEAMRRYRLMRDYGMTLEQVDKMFADQHGRCGICFDILEKFHVDHCHATGAVRALLCFQCNGGLGCFSDDTDRMERAIAYLKGYREDLR